VFREGIRERRNIVIAGGTASGKTTLASALMREIVALGAPAEGIAILEDTRELQCEARNAIQLHTGDVADLTRLVRVTMRLRPDRIIVGEVRGGEALALLKAWNTGHPGGITTLQQPLAQGRELGRGPHRAPGGQPETLEQDVRRGGEQEPELIGVKARAAQAIHGPRCP
jgi:type IV secretion system protein VirB11